MGTFVKMGLLVGSFVRSKKSNNNLVKSFLKGGGPDRAHLNIYDKWNVKNHFALLLNMKCSFQKKHRKLHSRYLGKNHDACEKDVSHSSEASPENM